MRIRSIVFLIVRLSRMTLWGRRGGKYTFHSSVAYMTSPWHSDSFPCSYISLQFTILSHEVDFAFIHLLWHQQHHITVRGRGDQAACRASPRTLPSSALPSSPINYTSNISITGMRGSSALLCHDTRKHFLIFSFSLSLLNSVWTNFKKKRGKWICSFSGFTLSHYLHTENSLLI